MLLPNNDLDAFRSPVVLAVGHNFLEMTCDD